MRLAKVLLIAAVVTMVVPMSLMADTVSWSSNGFNFVASGTTGGFYGANGVQITLKVTDTNSFAGWMQGFSMKDSTVQSLTSAHLDAPLTGATATAHIGFNNGSGNCSGNDPLAFCVDTGLGAKVDNLDPLTFIVSLKGSGPLTLTDLATWHLQTLVTDRLCSGTGCTGTDDKNTKTLVALSTTGTVNHDCTTNCTPTPEPATLTLLGAGLLGIGGMIRRKK